MSDTVSILLFCLMLLVPVAVVVGLAEFFSRKSKRRRRGPSNGSVSDSMNDISNAL
jgi:hypothetical protein